MLVRYVPVCSARPRGTDSVAAARRGRALRVGRGRLKSADLPDDDDDEDEDGDEDEVRTDISRFQTTTHGRGLPVQRLRVPGWRMFNVIAKHDAITGPAGAVGRCARLVSDCVRAEEYGHPPARWRGARLCGRTRTVTRGTRFAPARAGQLCYWRPTWHRLPHQWPRPRRCDGYCDGVDQYPSTATTGASSAVDGADDDGEDDWTLHERRRLPDNCDCGGIVARLGDCDWHSRETAASTPATRTTTTRTRTRTWTTAPCWGAKECLNDGTVMYGAGLHRATTVTCSTRRGAGPVRRRGRLGYYAEDNDVARRRGEWECDVFATT